ncbi:MAG TPA: hypothetical protein VHY31_14420 [Streptosporangiaceae bacterium]|nr:hypothetical protein [Streptosporangiaceae bacterium]
MPDRELEYVKIVLPEKEMREEERFPDQLHDNENEAGQDNAAAAGPGRELRPVNDLGHLERAGNLGRSLRRALAMRIRDRQALRATTLEFSAGMAHGA